MLNFFNKKNKESKNILDEIDLKDPYKNLKFRYNYDYYDIHGTLKEEHDKIIDDLTINSNKAGKLFSLARLENYYLVKGIYLQFVTIDKNIYEDFAFFYQRSMDIEMGNCQYYCQAQMKLDFKYKTNKIIFQIDENTTGIIEKIDDILYGEIITNTEKYTFQMDYKDFFLFGSQAQFDEYLQDIINKNKQQIIIE